MQNAERSNQRTHQRHGLTEGIGSARRLADAGVAIVVGRSDQTQRRLRGRIDGRHVAAMTKRVATAT